MIYSNTSTDACTAHNILHRYIVRPHIHIQFEGVLGTARLYVVYTKIKLNAVCDVEECARKCAFYSHAHQNDDKIKTQIGTAKKS